MVNTGDNKYPSPLPSANPDTPGDMLLLNQRLAKMNGAGIAKVADAAGLAALVTAGDATDGLVVEQTDTKTFYLRVGSAWVTLLEETVWVAVGSGATTPYIAPPFAATWSSGSYATRFRRKNGRVELDGNLYRGTAPSAGVVAFVLPSGFRPPSTMLLPIGPVSWAAHAQVEVDGTVTIQANLARTASALGYPLTGLSFPVA